MEAGPDSPVSLARAELFQGTTAEVLASLEAAARLHSLAAGEPILAGEASDAQNVYVVLEGKVGIYRPTEVAGDLLLAEIEPGGTFGEFSVVSGVNGFARAEALSTTVIAEIPGGVFHEVLRSDPSVSLALLQKLVRLVREMDARLAELSAQDQAVVGLHRLLVRYSL